MNRNVLLTHTIHRPPRPLDLIRRKGTIYFSNHIMPQPVFSGCGVFLLFQDSTIQEFNDSRIQEF